MTGTVFSEKFHFNETPIRKSVIKQMKNCIYSASANKMNSGQIQYYDGYDSYDCLKKIHLIKPLTEVKRNT